MKKWYQDPKFIEGALIFFIIQPLILLTAIGAVISGIVQSIWPNL